MQKFQLQLAGGAVRVTIEHRETGRASKRQYFVDCAIEFSAAEHAVIKQRALRNHEVTQTGRPPAIAGALAADAGLGCVAWLVRLVGGAVAIGGIISGLLSSMGGGGPGWVIFFLGAAIFIASFFIEIKGEMISERAIAKADKVSIGDILDRGRFSVVAPSPAHAKGAEDKLREDLAILKALLTGSEEMGRKKSFEL